MSIFNDYNYADHPRDYSLWLKAATEELARQGYQQKLDEKDKQLLHLMWDFYELPPDEAASELIAQKQAAKATTTETSPGLVSQNREQLLFSGFRTLRFVNSRVDNVLVAVYRGK